MNGQIECLNLSFKLFWYKMLIFSIKINVTNSQDREMSFGLASISSLGKYYEEINNKII